MKDTNDDTRAFYLLVKYDWESMRLLFLTDDPEEIKRKRLEFIDNEFDEQHGKGFREKQLKELDDLYPDHSSLEYKEDVHREFN
ncbi:MAG TPA: hypothetical protein VKM55_30900 [Candidatus Lokiarchaeia archaeon]|nr:hypothetical protein [Candidatus Lokiarchaeia archaeon]